MSGRDTWTRAEYDRASRALDDAHKACLKHPDRGPVGMSHGAFSGVNVALGIVAELEQFRDDIRAKLAAGYRILGPDEVDPVTVKEADLAVWKVLSGTPAYAEPQVIAQKAIRSLGEGR